MRMHRCNGRSNREQFLRWKSVTCRTAIGKAKSEIHAETSGGSHNGLYTLYAAAKYQAYTPSQTTGPPKKRQHAIQQEPEQWFLERRLEELGQAIASP